jgi:hypothetical protein
MSEAPDVTVPAAAEATSADVVLAARAGLSQFNLLSSSLNPLPRRVVGLNPFSLGSRSRFKLSPCRLRLSLVLSHLRAPEAPLLFLSCVSLVSFIFSPRVRGPSTKSRKPPKMVHEDRRSYSQQSPCYGMCIQIIYSQHRSGLTRGIGRFT